MAQIINPYAQGSPLTLSLVGSVTSVTSSVNVSATGRQAGDIGLMFDFALDTVAVTPSGHTQGNLLDVAPYAAMISVKIMAGSEGAITGMDDDTGTRKVYLIYRPSRAVTAFAFNSRNNQVTSGNPTAQIIAAASSPSVPVLLYGQMVTLDFNPISPRRVSPAMTEIGGANWHYVHHLAYNASPLDHSYDMDDEGAGAMIQSGYLTFT